MKVFAMNDCDWMAGESLESVKAEYLARYADGLSEDEAMDDPRELNESEMDSLWLREDDVAASRTFRQQLDRLGQIGTTFPCFFASTEY